MTEESLKLRLFPFSLKKSSFYQLGSIFTWVGLAEAFYRKFYSKQKTATIHQALNTFHQLPEETFFTYFERFNDLLLE